MNDTEKLNLQKLLNDKTVEQTTEKIRKLKHSRLIKQDISTILAIKRKYSKLRKETIDTMCVKRANFLFKNYTNIYNRLLRDELDLNILGNFVEVLRRIEDGEIDQHQGSYEIGVLLKRLYIDSALKKDKSKDKDKKPTFQKVKHKLSWHEFKMMQESENAEK